MFKAARDRFAIVGHRLVGAWRDLRGRGLIGLFVFEIVVVTLGVLLAQGVANWTRERQALADMEEAKRKAEQHLADAAYGVVGWRRMQPCLEELMGSIMRAGTSGGNLDAERLRRPGMFGLTFEPLSGPVLSRVEDRYGQQVENALSDAATQISTYNQRIDMIQVAWKSFALLDPALGTVEKEDYREARLAAAEILAALRGMSINEINILDYAEIMKVEPEPLWGGRFVESCEEMWSEGQMFLEEIK